jgi:hypothetical protein
MFVDQPYLDDYRIQFVIKAGAMQIRYRPITWYHQRLRRRIVPRVSRRTLDRVVSYIIGRYFLKKHGIQVIVNEWSGAFGREMAEYILRPATQMGIPSISLPHGYIIWLNSEINQLELNLWQTKNQRPDFSERNTYSAYVVQNEEGRRYYLARGVQPKKIVMLGSARFCPEWHSINYKLTRANFEHQDKKNKLVVLFFTPDWKYNVNKKACVTLLKRIAEQRAVSLMIKANTRGTGSFDEKEISEFRSYRNVSFPETDQNSTALIRSADVIINFASSIGLEAILQRKPVCNPVYLNGNSTIFDKSGVVFDAADDNEVVSFVQRVQRGSYAEPEDDVLMRFLEKYVLGGGNGNSDVLQTYVDFLSEQIGDQKSVSGSTPLANETR